MTQNWPVPDDMNDGRPPGGPPGQGSAVATAPAMAAPIPELVVVDSVAEVLSAFAGEDAPAGVIGDEERTRYGLLLDRAAERGLLSPAEYEVRLRALAEATTVERLQELVTVLPVLESPGAAPARRRRGPARPPSPDDAPLPAGTVARRSSPWFVLAVLVVVLMVALVFVAVYAQHVVHGNHSGAPAPGAVLRAVSALRS